MLKLSLCVLLLCSLGVNAQQTATPSTVRMLDLDGDGRLDKLHFGVDGSLRVSLHAGGRTYFDVPQELPRVSVASVLLEDLDGDGALDLYLISNADNVALRGDGKGGFRVATEELGLADAGEGQAAERIDLDEDGSLDLLLHNRTHDVVYWATGNGSFERDGAALPIKNIAQPSVFVIDKTQAPLDTDKAAGLPSKPTKTDDLPPKASTPRPIGSGVLRDEPSATTRRALDPGFRPTTGFQQATPLLTANLVQGTGTAGMLSKWISATKLGNSELFESAGDVGIGTLSPAGKLDVAGSVAVNGSQVIDGAGQWVGDPTGLVGPQGPPGVVSFGLNNTRGGTDALMSNTSGDSNSAFGSNTLRDNTTGGANTAIGSFALTSNTTGTGNTASGSFALYVNTIGADNTASGNSALRLNTSGSRNVAVGSGALLLNTTAGYNTAVGHGTLTYNQTGYRNVALGSFALRFNTTASRNTAIGMQALRSNTTGNSNTALGHRAGYNWTTGDNNIAIGNEGVAGESGVIRIGTPGTHSTTLLVGNVGLGTDDPDVDFALDIEDIASGPSWVGSIAAGGSTGNKVVLGELNGVATIGAHSGDLSSWSDLSINPTGNVGIGTQSPAFRLDVNGAAHRFDNSSTWTVSSDERLKQNIADLDGALRTLLALRGVSFEYKDPAQSGTRMGFIAQEVERVLPEWVADGEDGYKRLTVNGFEALAVEAFRELKDENAMLKRRLEAFEGVAGELAALRVAIAEQNR